MVRKIFLLISVICLFAGPLAAEESDYDFYKKYGHAGKSWNDLVKAGFEAYDKQDCENTLTSLKQAVAAQCQDALVYFKLAVCSEVTDSAYTAMQYYQLAEEKLQKLGGTHRYQKEIYENYGRALFKSKKYAEALPYLSRATAIGTPSFGLFYMVGFLNMKKGDGPAALSYFNQALAMDTSQAPPTLLAGVYKEVAKAHLAQKDFANALKLLDKSMQLNPQDQEAYRLRTEASTGVQQQSMVQMIQTLTGGPDKNQPQPQSQPAPPSAANLPPLEGSTPVKDPTPPMGTVVPPGGTAPTPTTPVPPPGTTSTTGTTTAMPPPTAPITPTPPAPTKLEPLPPAIPK